MRAGSVGLVGRVFEADDYDEHDDALGYSHQRRIERRDARLESLGQHLDDATESLRTRWAEELRWVHAEYLEVDQHQEAAELRERIAAELGSRPERLHRPLIRRQHLAWAQVCLDAVLDRVLAERDAEARSLLPPLLERARIVAGRADGAEILARAHELAHGLECRGGYITAARAHLGQLDLLADRFPTRSVRESQARALGEAVQAELRGGARWVARSRVAELREQAGRAFARGPECTALALALLALHEHADGSERVALERELEALASRPGAAHEQRWALTQALGRVERSGRRILRAPVELLRARAYRGAEAADIRALFERLEAELPECARIFEDSIGLLNELRALADRPEADPELRLRFARHWFESGFDARRYDYGTAANERSAHAWAREAAERGQLEGQVLLGRCLARGWGTPRDRGAAAELWRQAAARGSDEAQMLLRRLGVERFPWLRHRYDVLMTFGLVMLIVHLLTQPFVFDVLGVIAAVGLMMGLMRVFRFVDRLLARRRQTSATRATGDLPYVYGRQVDAFQRNRWSILGVVREDGFSLAPLAWLGISPLTATFAGLLFGLAHYPQYSLRVCLRLALGYFAMALLVLPWAGLWSVAAGHVLYDVVVYVRGQRWREKVEAVRRGSS